jgi:hypothetical protein
MNKEIKVEHYLLQLDRELHALPVSSRAEIITEIKSHIREASEQEGARDIDAILFDLGTPQAVAARYLSAKGITPRANKNGAKWFKWLAIGTVGFFAFIFLSGIAIVWYLSPIIKVDEKQGHVRLFGGLIDVKEDIGEIKIGDVEINDLQDGHRSEGREDLTGKSIHTVKIPFNTAKIEIETNEDNVFSWKCKTTGNKAPEAQVSAGTLLFDLDSLNLVKCTIGIPAGLATEVKGVNGHMDVDYPSGNVDIALTNGKVNVHPDPAKVYDFEVKVKNGLQDFFPRSRDKNALKVKVSVVNGLVNKE